MRSHIPHKYAALLLVVATLIAASGRIFSKEAIAYLPIFGFIGLRFLLASICLLPFCYRYFSRVDSIDLFKAFCVGALMGSALLLWVYAVSVSDTLGEGGFIMSLSMLFVPLVAWALFGDKPTNTFWYSLPFAVIGLILLSLGREWHQSSGQLWFLVSAMLLAVHFNFNSRYAQRIPVLLLTTIRPFCTGLIGLVASAFFEVWPSNVPDVTWVWFTLSVLVATSFRYVIQTLGQKGTSTENAAIIMILEPVWTMLLSMWWLGEQMSLNKVMGFSFILFAIVINRSGAMLK
ncbi:DMT family transporter [Colwellia sp. MSW7]|uniref:DMT family transporter n=1 Tax=Colwellia maritima TaxID=2912588 RepID=A0ABS9WYF2_9GAMM|nr:DMT family transporter [Colwellia maritima]MCI2283033.1 DMT family transporter [Colwellia maritima]